MQQLGLSGKGDPGLTWLPSVGYSAGRSPMRERDVVADFSATDQDGNRVTLTGLLESGPLVLFFYPKAMTPG